MSDRAIEKNKAEWESHYDNVIPVFDFKRLGNYDARHPYIKRLIRFGEGKKRSLEFGSGKGGLSLALKMNHPEIETHLLDFSANAVDFSKRLFAHFNLEGHFHEGSFLDLPFPDGHFDFIHGNTVLEHVRDTEKAVAELVRVLAPGGHIIITVPNRRRRWAHDLYHFVHNLQYFSRTFYPDEFKQLFTGKFFEIDDYFGEGFIFIFPSYIPRLFVELARRRKGHAKAQENCPDHEDDNESSPKKKTGVLKKIIRNPMIVPDRLWFPILIWLNRVVGNYELLPTSWFITIGIVARKPPA